MNRKFDLVTPRLVLSPLSIEYTDELARVYADPDVARYIGGERLTPEVVEQQVAAFATEWDERGFGQSAVINASSGEFLGRIGLHYWENWDEVELGYILGKSAQGKGYAREGAQAWIDWAAAAEGLDYIIANIHPDNAASIRMAGKLGFDFDRHDMTPSGLPTLIYRRNF
ncbi:GNAT family N-acetyltransferase [Arthrobacter flavus]|uniref:GNAT family N-acetyltransferase n=1 Tax=Arthrobacter flavus TaxID=95172 RepID=A0ABW4Q7W2_9MICC